MGLTKGDLNAIKDFVKVTIEETGLVTKEDLSHLPTKEEFYEKMDEVATELKADG